MRDDDGQFDGDYSRSPFARNFQEQPWLRSNLPPWHTWGTVEVVDTVATTLALPATFTGTSQQLSRVNYKRPDTWQWLFYARIVSAPNGGGVANPCELAVDFDVTVGLGRASTTLPTFERFGWTWETTPPLTDIKWSTAARQPIRFPGDTLDHSLTKIVAQDIQCSGRFAAAGPNPLTATPFVLEIGSFFAPRSHIRPDWYLDGPNETVFAGDEVGGT